MRWKFFDIKYVAGVLYTRSVDSDLIPIYTIALKGQSILCIFGSLKMLGIWKNI